MLLTQQIISCPLVGERPWNLVVKIEYLRFKEAFNSKACVNFRHRWFMFTLPRKRIHIYAVLYLWHLTNLSDVIKAELLQLNHAQFICMRNFVNKKVGNPFITSVLKVDMYNILILVNSISNLCINKMFLQINWVRKNTYLQYFSFNYSTNFLILSSWKRKETPDWSETVFFSQFASWIRNHNEYSLKKIVDLEFEISKTIWWIPY